MVKYKGFTISKISKRDRMYLDGFRYRATHPTEAKAFGGTKMYGRTITEIKSMITESHTRIVARDKKIAKLRLEIKRKKGLN